MNKGTPADPLREAMQSMVWGLRHGAFTDPAVIAERIDLALDRAALATKPAEPATITASEATDQMKKETGFEGNAGAWE